MKHAEPRPVVSLSLLAATIVAVAITLVPSAPASGATSAAGAKHRCLSHASHRHSRHASHRRSRHASHRRSRHASHRRSRHASHKRSAHCSVRASRRQRRKPGDTTPPTAPTNLTAAPGDAQVALSWGASTDKFGVAGYRVYRNGGQVTDTSSTSFTDIALTNGVTYSYYVVA